MDLSLVASGWAFAVDGKVCGYGLLPTRSSGIERIIFVRNRACDKVDELKPDLIVFEDLYFSRDPTSQERAGLAFMIRAELFSDKIPYFVTAPASLKKFVVGRGGSKKSPVPKALVVKYIATRFNHANVDDDNICDAIGLAYIGMAMLGEWEPDMNAQREVLQTIRKNNPGIGPVVQPRQEEPSNLW